MEYHIHKHTDRYVTFPNMSQYFNDCHNIKWRKIMFTKRKSKYADNLNILWYELLGILIKWNFVSCTATNQMTFTWQSYTTDIGMMSGGGGGGGAQVVAASGDLWSGALRSTHLTNLSHPILSISKHTVTSKFSTKNENISTKPSYISRYDEQITR